MLMQNFFFFFGGGGQTKCIMREVQMANVVFVAPTLDMRSDFG